MITEHFVNASVTPRGNLDTLSPQEVARLQDRTNSGLYTLFRQCALAVLNTGSEMDSTRQVLDRFRQFDVQISHKFRDVQLDLINAPASAFVDGEMIQGIREHLFSVLRDLLYVQDALENCCDGMDESSHITHLVFHILRHAGAMRPHIKPDMVVCWGGHSINRVEYEYTKKVGYELGIRKLNICTGCGPGAMKGPMKGATIAHAKQRVEKGRYLGITEPGIIAAESPNPIVNELLIMPDIEKRLEAFVRVGHGIIVFPGGAGTAEEILYILGILLRNENQDIPFPLLFTGPEESQEYFETLDRFIQSTLGERARGFYEIITGDAHAVAMRMKELLDKVTAYRKKTGESFHFNWDLNIPLALQKPFEPTHQSMAALNLSQHQPDYELAAQLRCALSGIVAGNVKEQGIKAIEEHGPFELKGDPNIIQALAVLLDSFVEQRRMKINHHDYVPCFKLAAQG